MLVLRAQISKSFAYIILRFWVEDDDPTFFSSNRTHETTSYLTYNPNLSCKKQIFSLMLGLFLTFYSSKYHNGFHHATFRGVKSELWKYIYFASLILIRLQQERVAKLIDISRVAIH